MREPKAGAGPHAPGRRGGSRRSSARESLSEIARVVELDDPVLRNLHITYRYHVLAAGLRDAVGTRDANWPTFATWASKTAGESIRGEELPAAVRRMAATGSDMLIRLERFNRAIPWAPDLGFDDLLLPVERAMQDLSLAIAAGNLKVFAELAPLFVTFAEVARSSGTYDAASLARFTAGLAAGPVEDGGQDLLRGAFEAYYQACHERDPVRRARLILFANCSIGFHEQTRLQPEIERAMRAPVDSIVRAAALAGLRALLPERFEARAEAALSEPLDTFVESVSSVFRRLATRFLMDLSLPFGREIPLGAALPPWAVPDELTELGDPEGLASLWQRFDMPGDDTAARDWVRIPDRMNYIVNLFRSRQRDEDLFSSPFADDAVGEILAGRIPAAVA